MAKAKKAVEIVVIADRSGSMASIRKDAIGGFNSFLADQKKVKGKAVLTLALFDDKYELPIEAKPLEEVPELTEETYVPRGSTALYDAIGRTLTALNTRKPEKAIIVILTDGQENASREFTKAQVKTLIEDAEKGGWKVIYLAMDMAAFNDGFNFGILRSNAVFANRADPLATQDLYKSASLSTESYRADVK